MAETCAPKDIVGEERLARAETETESEPQDEHEQGKQPEQPL